MSILSVDQISPIGSGTTITLNATEIKTGTEITVGTGASIFSPAGNTLTLGTNSTERLRITNAGALGLSGTNYGSSGQVLTSAGSGSAPTWSAIPAQVTISNNADNRVITGGSGVNLNGESSLLFDPPNLEVVTTNSSYGVLKLDGNSGGLIEFKDNGTRKWELYGAVDFSFYDRANTKYGLILKSGGNVEVSDGDLKIATSGHGIDFSAQTPTSATGASTTAEILDHYEEGSWTPVFINVNTPSYTTQYGIFTRVGRMVLLHGQISVSSIDNSDGSTVAISGLPFTGNSSAETCLFTFGRYTNLLPEAKLDQFTNARFGGTYVMLHEGNNADISYAELNSSGTIQFSISYMMN